MLSSGNVASCFRGLENGCGRARDDGGSAAEKRRLRHFGCYSINSSNEANGKATFLQVAAEPSRSLNINPYFSSP